MKIEHSISPPKRTAYIITVILTSIFTMAASTFATIHFLHKVSMVTIPDISNKSIESARSILRVKRMKMEIVEYRFDPRIAANHILQQTPLPGELVENIKPVQVIVSRGMQSGKVPMLIGLPLSKAIQQLTNAGFNVGRTTRYYTAEAEKDIVLDHHPSAEDEIQQGSNIHLLVSQGKRPIWLMMPNLKGWPADDAVSVIHFIGMQLQEIKRITSTDAPPGIILDQTPHAGSRTQSGDPAGLGVSHQESEIFSETRLVAIDYITPPARKEVRIKFFIRDNTGLHEIYNAMEKSNSKISLRRTVSGDSATLYIYLNGKLQEERKL